MENKEILKTIESKGFNKTLWNKAGKAMHRYNMIKAGDRICVGISGGKDSLTLFNLLLRVKMIVNFDFEIFPVYVSQTEEVPESFEKVKEYLKSMGHELHIERTNIDKVVFIDRQEKNPCSLCSRMRRGVLYRIMQEKGYNKLALGHHLDDIIETFLMNLFYQGNMKEMKPYYVSEQYGFEIIRPMAFVEEDTIVKYSKKIGVPVVGCLCKLHELKTDPKRLEMKILIKNLQKKNSTIRKSMQNAFFGNLEGEI